MIRRSNVRAPKPEFDVLTTNTPNDVTCTPAQSQCLPDHPRTRLSDRASGNGDQDCGMSPATIVAPSVTAAANSPARPSSTDSSRTDAVASANVTKAAISTRGPFGPIVAPGVFGWPEMRMMQLQVSAIQKAVVSTRHSRTRTVDTGVLLMSSEHMSSKTNDAPTARHTADIRTPSSMFSGVVATRETATARIRPTSDAETRGIQCIVRMANRSKAHSASTRILADRAEGLRLRLL